MTKSDDKDSNALSRKQLVVLVVDDEIPIRRILERALAQAGAELHTAVDGVTALQVMDTQAIDVIVTDLMMPQMNGLQLIQNLKRKGKAVPFIVVSGCSDMMEIQKLKDEGIFAFISKPVANKALLKAVKNAVYKTPRSS